MGDVYQWFADVSGDTLRIKTILREYDNTVATGDMEFEPTAWLLELVLRRVLESEVKTTLAVLEKKYSEERKQVYEELLRRSSEQHAEMFIEGFEPFVSRGRKRGRVMLEPHSADKSEPPLTVSGTEFPNQGDPATSRIRLMVQKEQTFVPLMLTTSADHFDADRMRDGDSGEMAWTDFRLLAGSMTEVSHGLIEILQGIPNMLVPTIRIGQSGIFPTILDATVLDRLTAVSPIGQLAMACEPAVKIINDVIAERRVQTQSAVALEPLQQMLRNMNGDVSELAVRVRRLAEDPVLFVLGPVLSATQAKNIGVVYIGGQRAEARTHILPGFETDTLETHYGGTCAFSTDSNDVITNCNTVYNLLLNADANIAIRLSDWQKAMEGSSVIYSELPEVATDGGVSITSQRWMSDVVQPHVEKQFRAHLVMPRESTAGLEMDIGAGGRYTAFESVIHDGDVRAYVEEATSVIRMALAMLLVKAGDVGGRTAKRVAVRELYDDAEEDLFDRFVPVITRLEPRRREALESVDVTDGGQSSAIETSWGGRGLSACSAFLYKHVAIAMSTPMKAAFPTHREVSSFLAKSVPFPVTDPALARQIDAATATIRTAIESKCKRALHFHQIDTRYTRNVTSNQPYATPFCHFRRTTSSNGLTFCCGSEATNVIEALMLSIHLVNAVTDGKERTPTTFKSDTPEPISVDIHQSDIRCKASALRTARTAPTTQFKDRTKRVIDATRYAAYLELTTPDSMNQAGNAVFGGDPAPTRAPTAGVVGWFRVVQSHTTVDKVVSKSWFTGVRRHEYEAEYTLYKSLLGPSLTVTAGTLQTEEDMHPWQLKVGGIPLDGVEPIAVETFADALYVDLVKMETGTKTFEGVCVPLRYASSGELVGYARFRSLCIRRYNSGEQSGYMISWDRTVLSHMSCLCRGAVRKMADMPDGKSKWAFVEEVLCGVERSGPWWMVIPAGIPILTTAEHATPVLEQTSQLDADTRQSLKFTEAEAVVSMDKLATMLVDGFTGLHYSSTAAAPHTSFAVVVGETRDEVEKSLMRKDSRFGDAWAIDSNENTEIAKIVRALYYEFTRSTTRNTDTAMVEPVEVNVKGPGPGSETTKCTVSGKGIYLYRTDHYKMIETMMVARLRATVEQSFSMPSFAGSLGSEIRARASRYCSIKDILMVVRGDASAITRLMLSLSIVEKLDRETARARDKRTVANLNTHVQSSIDAVLKLPLRGGRL